ncbi:unnamed protein product [Bemisia tabaci]|uniref:Uncharacterized protein n=1 Tax=Bemisia tabaci TaxID=7038 RepID=A0A9P0AB23_BEMTA|nr:unnamed protein product [Bemisia tabaci]
MKTAKNRKPLKIMAQRKEDLPEDVLKKNMERRLTFLQLNDEEREALERKTIGQSKGNKAWDGAREARLTASDFGFVCKNKIRLTYPGDTLAELQR